MRIFLSFLLLLAFAASPAVAQDISSNLQAHYEFDDATDSSGNSRTLSGSAGSFSTGIIGNAAVNPQFTSTGHAYMNSASSYSISCWVQIRDEYPVVPAYFVPSSSAVGELMLHVKRVTPSTKGKSDSPTIGDWRSGKAGTASASAIIGTVSNPNYSAETVDDWQFVALVLSSGAATLYSAPEGGSLVSASLDGNWTLPANVAQLRVGRTSGGSYAIDELRVYSRALASGDVQALFAEAE